MRIRQLECFVAVADELSFVGAAGRLHISQSAVSKLVDRLERDLGVRLFHRSTRQVWVSYAGQQLLPIARGVVAGVRRIEEVALQCATADGEQEPGLSAAALTGGRSTDDAGEAYQSDLSDAQWAVVKLLLPPHAQAGSGWRAKHPRRRIVDAIMYVQGTGCAWRQLPKDFPPWATVYYYFARWHDDGCLDRVYEALWNQTRGAEGTGGTHQRS